MNLCKRTAEHRKQAPGRKAGGYGRFGRLLMGAFTIGACVLAACVVLTACGHEYKPIDLESIAASEAEKSNETDEAGSDDPDPAQVIEIDPTPEKLWVRVPCNLKPDPDSLKLGDFVDRGTCLNVKGVVKYAGSDDIRYYEVEGGYIRPWYTAETEVGALRSNDEFLEKNKDVGNDWGGGTGADPDYYPRDKEFNPNREMPERVKAIYLSAWLGGDYFDEFVEIAKSSGINAFVINITDNGEVAYPSEVMKEYCPSAYGGAINGWQHYADCIKRLKDEGFYVIGRMTTFQDDNLASDHPELCICDNEGNPKEHVNGYWPTPYSREVWQYKLEVAKEAVEWFGFDEIQFDYVRFPDRTQSLEKEGNIDYRNEYGETKVQAIQRFLMYAEDELHDMGVYAAADVFGEVSEGFVGGYGQYWPALSNVVDVMCGMPYPDHYEGTEEYKPWEHPYETVKKFADEVNEIQKLCPTPAKVRTWIQGYNAYKEPHTEYYAENVAKEIQALYDAGHTDGWMIWNGANSIKHCRAQAEIFGMEP